jgi:hypothetical protein
MKIIKLSKGKETIVDDEDFEWLNQWSWYFNTNGYAQRKVYVRGNKSLDEIWFMHRMVAETPEGMDTDHINGNKLDNRRKNLRIVTRSQNMMNGDLRSNNRSGCSGVSYDKKNRKWSVCVMVDRKNVFHKRFKELSDAIDARKTAETRYFGQFSRKCYIELC